MAALQGRLDIDAAVEASGLASDSHKAALEGWHQKRQDYAALQERQMRTQEEAKAQGHQLECPQQLDSIKDKQYDELLAKVKAGEMREEAMSKKIDEAKAQTQPALPQTLHGVLRGSQGLGCGVCAGPA